mmetsp:Transcript_29521/g.84526  ORF Transcript_29521/g.84526 Transcript_29521/m.84526 type:complete len:898 (-) Transcript_29521:179-2872(-)
MGYRSNCPGFSPPSSQSTQWRAQKSVLHSDAILEETTLEAFFKRAEDKDRFTTSYTKSFTQQPGVRLRLGSLQPLQEQSPPARNRLYCPDNVDVEASGRPCSTGFASTAFDSTFDLERPSSGASHRRMKTHDVRSAMSPTMLGHSQSDSLLRSPQQLVRGWGGLAPLGRSGLAESETPPGSAWGAAAARRRGRRPEGPGELVERPQSRGGPAEELLGGRGAGNSRPTGSASSEAQGERARSKLETRRTTVELLSNPDLKRIARTKFDCHDPARSGHLDFGNYRSVLQELHGELGLSQPDHGMAERLFKKFDIDYSNTLDFNEFFELLLALLRHNAFDRSAIFGRDFFVTKHQGSVWERYEKCYELGSGMFGTALLVKQRFTGEQQVVKAVRKSRVQIPVEDVEREILMLRQLDHPHVVRLRRWYEDKHSIYLVMDYLQGGSLKDKISEIQRQHHTLKERWVRALVQQVLQGMSYCHGLRLIHKDLKDENIMLLQRRSPDPEKEPFAVIIDLGMAELFSPMDPQCRHIGGTPVTMSPQVWTGTFGPKCDVWSLGCVVYQLLVGRVPFYVKSLNPEAWILEQKKGADWSKMKTSHASRDLCKAMLTFAEENRPSMATCLQHHWFVLEKKELCVIKPAQFAYLQEEYVRGSAVKRALLFELASALPMEDADRIVEIFKEFDVNNDGKVSLEEVQEAFAKMGLQDEKLAQKTFQALDLDQDGELSFTEFSSWLLLGFEDLMEDRLYKMLSEYNENPDSKALDNEGVKRFLRSMESMLQKGSIGRSSSLLKELRNGDNTMIPYEELKQRLLGPSLLPGDQEPSTRAPSPPSAEPVESASSGDSSVRGVAFFPPAALKAHFGDEPTERVLPKAAAVSPPPSRSRSSRIGISSLQRLRTMYSRR